ncbi:MAG: 3-hydroxyacyl-CoA dehydrogenase NAD-binding domain-containing protein [Candidatus Sumerlaeota bacterium]|nr:3-hydroxyacyl-CoA dehydrogenase NAD-binding domain-containing protein [Candidatus Sumerlaeota bacterium]
MITHVGVIGAGKVGQGIIQAMAQAGINVVFKEKSEALIKEAISSITGSLDRRIRRWAITPSEKAATLARIKGKTDYEPLLKAEIIIEAVRDDMEIKQSIFKEIAPLLNDKTILCTNTSTLSVTRLSELTPCPQRVAGMHFLPPADGSRLVEVVRGNKTAQETVATVKELIAQIDRTAIDVYEYPGYVTTRLILPLINEAMYIVMEGTASVEDVDKAMRLGYDFPIGPLQMADQMGLDELLLWFEHLWRELGESRFRPCPLLRMMVRAGYFGTKTSRGFFRYDKSGRRVGESFTSGMFAGSLFAGESAHDADQPPIGA